MSHMPAGVWPLLWAVLMLVPAAPVSGYSVIRTSLESIEPFPVEPGEDFSVKLRVYNDGDEASGVVLLDMLPSDHFLDTGDSTGDEEEFFLCAKCSKESIFYLTAKSGIHSGEYPLVFRITESGTVREEKVFVRIVGVPDVIFESSPVAGPIVPGGGFDARLVFRNIGTGTARNIKIAGLSDHFIRLGSSLAVIESLGPGEEEGINLSIKVAESLPPDTYKMPLEISFIDESGSRFLSTMGLGVEVRHQASLNLQNIRITPAGLIRLGDDIEIVLRVENAGEGDARDARVMLETPLPGSKVAYLGRIKEDDDEPAVFVLKAYRPGESEVGVRITYEDDFGRHEVLERFTVRVGSKERIAAGAAIAALLAAALGLGLFLYIRRKGKRK